MKGLDGSLTQFSPNHKTFVMDNFYPRFSTLYKEESQEYISCMGLKQVNIIPLFRLTQLDL